MVQDDEAVGLDALQVRFDDERAVCDAGVMLAATLAQRLGIEALAQRLVRLRSKLSVLLRTDHHPPGRSQSRDDRLRDK